MACLLSQVLNLRLSMLRAVNGSELVSSPSPTSICKQLTYLVTPTPISPPHKRALLSPFDAHSSPTEKDSVATPSPKSLRLSAQPSARHLPLDPALDALHTTTIEPNAVTDSNLHAAAVPHQQQSLEGAISSLLPGLLSSILPSLLPRLLTLQSPSPGPSLDETPSQRGTPPPTLSALLAAPNAPGTVPSSGAQPPRLSALGISISEHVSRTVESELSSLYSHTISHANFLRLEADAAFFDDREGERLAWQSEVESAIEEFRERLEDVGVVEVERVEEELEQKGNRAVAVVDTARAEAEVLKDEEAALKINVDKLKEEVRVMRRRKKDLKSDVDHLRSQKCDLRQDIADLRRQKAEMQGRRRSESRSSVHYATSATDSQDLDCRP